MDVGAAELSRLQHPEVPLVDGAAHHLGLAVRRGVDPTGESSPLIEPPASSSIRSSSPRTNTGHSDRMANTAIKITFSELGAEGGSGEVDDPARHAGRSLDGL